MDQDDLNLLEGLKREVKVCKICKGIGYLPGTIKCACYDKYEKTLKYIVANIPRVYWNFKLEQYVGNHGVTGMIKNYTTDISAAKHKGVGLLLYGTKGTGKTALLSCVMRSIVEKNFSADYTLLAKIFRAFMDHDNAFINHIHQVDFLAIDSVDQAYLSANTDYMEKLFDEIFRYRFIRKKPMIISYSNSREQLAQDLGTSIVSLFNECLIPILVAGEDYRPKLAKTLTMRLKEK